MTRDDGDLFRYVIIVVIGDRVRKWQSRWLESVWKVVSFLKTRDANLFVNSFQEGGDCNKFPFVGWVRRLGRWWGKP
jgi:hypothetical protein